MAMQQAVPVGTGAMAAVLALDPAQVAEGCAQAAADSGEVVEAANFNDPRQTVISGSVAGVDKAREVLKAMGAKRVVNLPVSAPFHCSLMRPAAEALRQRLADVPFAVPQIPLINNVDVAIQSDAEAIRDALYRQAFGPVRWVEVVRSLRARGLGHVVECGPGKVLAGMVKRIDADAQVLTLSDPASLAECKEQLQ
jgi:[acyl-carrier-protein] S-malonyltransferase